MPRRPRPDRTERRRQLLELLENGRCGTQEEIVRQLDAAGIPVTQATVSRDLEELGAVRVRRGQKTVYTIPERNGPPAGFGRRVFSEFVIDVAASANLVVVRTFPGAAPSLAAALDQSGISGVLGTVAGDDTVLAVADETVGGQKLAARIRAFARDRGAS